MTTTKTESTPTGASMAPVTASATATVPATPASTPPTTGPWASLSPATALALQEATRRIPQKIFFRIGEVAKLLEVKTSVLRFWETEFPSIHPTKAPSGHRVYRRKEVEKLFLIKHLLYVERFSIEGARKKLTEKTSHGVSAVDSSGVVLRSGEAPRGEILSSAAAGERSVVGPIGGRLGSWSNPSSRVDAPYGRASGSAFDPDEKTPSIDASSAEDPNSKTDPSGDELSIADQARWTELRRLLALPLSDFFRF